ncbi:glycosyltransferase family 4 protein [Tautonia sociabilis]|uniref:Glycosyltransferase n=1 Tax=Tautonia sociabilis TaxID=2080755 RepID=A0A432MNN7_9BACT|nr:glycosyltransferase [Tautonia sociabilis]RUL89063.1 glycosyltransferase [Tautonia sociabilis]
MSSAHAPPFWRRRFPPAPHRDSIATGRPALRRRTDRMRVLVAIPTTNQMYSGIGRAIIELSTRLRDRIAFTFAIDDRDPRSLRRVHDFAAPLGFPMLVGPHRFEPDCIEPLNVQLPEILSNDRWDAVELVGFANAATGRAVLDHLDDRTALCYTPHDQPLWTVPMSPEQEGNVAAVHRRVLDRADVVLADSEAERAALRRLAPGRLNCVTLPLGCDFDAFAAGPADRPPRLLFVGDLAEIRKRFDRVIDLFSRILERRPEYRLVVIGNRSDASAGLIPEAIRHAVELRGYVSESELRAAYASSRALVLLSDVEAFGLPILEALASGTPVLLGRLETTASLFSDCPGAHFCPLDDPEGTFAVADRLLADWRSAVASARADRPRLRSCFDWAPLADRKWQALSAAWARRNAWDWRRDDARNAC